MVRSFEPVVDEHTRVLVLGTMPGEQSLAKDEYYAHPRNQFWNIITALFEGQPQTSYAQKLDFLRQNGVGLWDVLGEAERKGSLDSSIENRVTNDFLGLLTRYPNIKCIALNGGEAAELFRKHIKPTLPREVRVIALPSTSPTPGRNVKSYEEKVQSWSVLLEC